MMHWTDGWHDINAGFSILIEKGKFVRGILSGRTVYPYIYRRGIYNNCGGILKASKANFDRITSWQ